MRFRHSTPPRLTASDIEHAAAAVFQMLTPSTVTYPEEAIAFAVDQYATKGGRRRDDVRVVAGELLANAVLHGNEQDPAKTIRTRCLWRKGFYLAVQDEGPGFDVTNPPFVAGRSGVPPEGGLGLPYAKRRADLLYTCGSTVVSWFREG